MAGWLIDTSVLTRRVNRKDPQHRVARDAVRALRARGEALCVAPQNMYELWSVCTRPQTSNGLGLTPEHALRVILRIEQSFRLLPDPPGLYEEWKRLVGEHRVSGRPSHDARLVAAMNLHRLRSLLTFNGPDFVRYPGILVVHPREV